MSKRTIKRALISVYDKKGIDSIARLLTQIGVEIISTGGTYQFIKDAGVEVSKVEDLTEYPSILGGRVKTLHPKVFGGILAMRTEEHRAQLEKYLIPEIDLVIVDLYPFEETLKSGKSDADIIEQIDIGGISLIRAAAKNFNDVLVIPSRDQYGFLRSLIEKDNTSDLSMRRKMAAESFKISSAYDNLIAGFMADQSEEEFSAYANDKLSLRYGENPHQTGEFYGNLEEILNQIQGKELSYNNLNDIEAALRVMQDLPKGKACCAVIKHTNTCGLAVRNTVEEAWDAALAGDPISAFGGIIVFNRPVNKAVAEKINKLFYEVLIAPEYEEMALEILTKKKKRIILELKSDLKGGKTYKSLLNGVLVQDLDEKVVTADDIKIVTQVKPTAEEIDNLLFANICVKHLKSNGIALTKNMQLIGIGTGQTSRVDALRQALEKAERMGFDTQGAVMASDAFFPFPDCVEIAHDHKINLVIQPGGSIKDKDSIEYCDKHGMKMVFSGVRHFKHG